MLSRQALDKCLRQRGEMEVTHTVQHTVGGCIGFGLKTEVEHVGQMIPIFQQIHVAIGSPRKIATTHQHIHTNHSSVLHHQPPHVASILDALKGNGALRVSHLRRKEHGRQHKDVLILFHCAF